MRSAPVLSALVLLLTACTSDAPSDRDVLISLTDEVIVPAYQTVAQDVAQLDQDVKTLCDAPSDTSLENARRSWRRARASWMRSEAMWFGPVMERRSISLLDWSPTDAEGVDRLLAEARPITADEVRDALAANQRGFGAIERLLFSGGALAGLSQSAYYCSYLGAMTAATRQEADAILSEWVDGTDHRPPYQDYFTDRANSALVSSAAVAQVIRTQVFLIRVMVDMRLASVLGLRGDGPDLSAVPGDAADNGLQDLRQEVLGMQAVYEGSGQDAIGVSALVLPLSEETDLRLRQQFDAAIAAIDGVEGPLRIAVVERPVQVRGVYDRLSDVQRTISVEVVSLLGVSVGFSDTDGDSLR